MSKRLRWQYATPMSPGVTIGRAASPEAGRNRITCPKLQRKTIHKVERIKTLQCMLPTCQQGAPQCVRVTKIYPNTRLKSLTLGFSQIPRDLHRAMLQEQPWPTVYNVLLRAMHLQPSHGTQSGRSFCLATIAKISVTLRCRNDRNKLLKTAIQHI